MPDAHHLARELAVVLAVVSNEQSRGGECTSGHWCFKKGFNAVFFDGADEWVMHSRHTWKVATNVPKNATDQVVSAHPQSRAGSCIRLRSRCKRTGRHSA